LFKVVTFSSAVTKYCVHAKARHALRVRQLDTAHSSSGGMTRPYTDRWLPVAAYGIYLGRRTQQKTKDIDARMDRSCGARAESRPVSQPTGVNALLRFSEPRPGGLPYAQVSSRNDLRVFAARSRREAPWTNAGMFGVGRRYGNIRSGRTVSTSR